MTCTCTVEPHPNEVLETMKNTLPHQASKGIQQIGAKGYLNCLDYYKKVSLLSELIITGLHRTKQIQTTNKRKWIICLITNMRSFIAKRAISILRHLRLKLPKYKENNKKIHNTSDHDLKTFPYTIMSNVSPGRHHLVILVLQYDAPLKKNKKWCLTRFAIKLFVSKLQVYCKQIIISK